MKKTKEIPEDIRGSLSFPKTWTVFAPCEATAPVLSEDDLKKIPQRLNLGGKIVPAETVTPTRCQHDFASHFGKGPYQTSHCAWAFVPLESEAEQEVTLGFGADYYLQVWLNGHLILDTTEKGNAGAPPSPANQTVHVTLSAGCNVVAVRLLSGIASGVLAMGGPEELRKRDFATIRPDLVKAEGANIFEVSPPDPEACITWRKPDGFDPDVAGLGLPQFEEVEHFDLLRCHPSTAPLDEGGSGVYESLEHGTWNHNIKIFQYRDRLLGIWDNHALDENGPGSRVVARVGKILNERGDIDWGGKENIIEIAPAAVPVRRRKLISDSDRIPGAQATGAFRIVGDRLIYCGRLTALHGVSSAPDRVRMPKKPLAPEHFHFGKGPGALRAGYVVWDLGFTFYQEWAVVDDRLQPVSPIYKRNELPSEIQVTTELALPLEPLIPPYRDAPLLSEAPEDLQKIIEEAGSQGFGRNFGFAPGTERTAHDGINGLTPGHSAEFVRPDGSRVIIVENQGPPRQYFYYASERPDDRSFYPPPRRSSLYGGVKPTAGELSDGTVYVVGNSPERRNMFLTTSKDGRHFDQTWLLRHERLSDYTPGAMKGEGGPGSGPQYFRHALIGESLWIVYSISKEHVAVSRVQTGSLMQR